MRLKTLLQAYDIDELMPVINDMFPGVKKYRRHFEHAYRLLMDTQPVKGKKNIRYKLLAYNDSNERYVGADDAQFRDTWAVCLGKEVEKSHSLDITQIELAANCLVNLCLLSDCPGEFLPDRRELLRN